MPPFLISLTTLQPRPMAAMARVIKNLLSSLSGANTDDGTPRLMAIVVIREATINYKINIGKAFLKLNPPSFELLPDCFALNKARTKVIGIIARVLVSLTVTALSSV